MEWGCLGIRSERHCRRRVSALGWWRDDHSISTIDPSGIALAVIQALNQKLIERPTQQATESEGLRNQIAEPREMIRAQARKRK